MEGLYKVLYDYDAQRNDELSLKTGDQVHVLEQENDDWCIAENVESGQQGAVFTKFLELMPSEHGASIDTNDGPVLAKVLQDYTAQDTEELSLWKNGIVTVLDSSFADGWWKGDLNGKSGIFPSDHVKLIDASSQQEQSSEPDENKRQSFKLAAYGVKQGGIGSILAGGFNLRKKGTKKETSQESTPQQQLQCEQTASTINANVKSLQDTTADRPEKAIVVSAYAPQNEDELQLLPGAYVTNIEKLENEDEGWWKGMNEKGEQGVFPSNFVQILSNQDIPSRPMRARPPMIKTDLQQQPTSPTMAKPPPVPAVVGNRPSSLSTARRVTEQAPRPITSPSMPLGRTNSVIRDHQQPPSVSSPGTGSSNVTPVSPTSLSGLAKVPKTFGKSSSGARSSTNSQVSFANDSPSLQGFADDYSGDGGTSSATPLPPPRTPKRSIPSVPPPPRSSMNVDDESHYQHSRDLSNGSINSSLSSVASPTTMVPPPKKNTDSNNYDSEDPLEKKLRQWFKEEAQTMRQEFESQLENERCHRRQLEQALESLKRQL